MATRAIQSPQRGRDPAEHFAGSLQPYVIA